jgi:uncharacterized protein YjiS (DUF1127 family)
MLRTQTISRDVLRARHSLHLFARISTWFALRRQRARLAGLDAAALNDLGLTRPEAEAEARRPFWDVPQHWLK